MDPLASLLGTCGFSRLGLVSPLDTSEASCRRRGTFSFHPSFGCTRKTLGRYSGILEASPHSW